MSIVCSGGQLRGPYWIYAADPANPRSGSAQTHHTLTSPLIWAFNLFFSQTIQIRRKFGHIIVLQVPTGSATWQVIRYELRLPIQQLHDTIARLLKPGGQQDIRILTRIANMNSKLKKRLYFYSLFNWCDSVWYLIFQNVFLFFVLERKVCLETKWAKKCLRTTTISSSRIC